MKTLQEQVKLMHERVTKTGLESQFHLTKKNNFVALKLSSLETFQREEKEDSFKMFYAKKR